MTSVTGDLEEQVARDKARAADWLMWLARVRAVSAAQHAVAIGDTSAVPALRQALIDLAAVCVVRAEDLPVLRRRAAVLHA